MIFILNAIPPEVENPHAVYTEGSYVSKEERLLALVIHNKFKEGVQAEHQRWLSLLKEVDIDQLLTDYMHAMRIITEYKKFSGYVKERL